jgi:hypothetical protein
MDKNKFKLIAIFLLLSLQLHAVAPDSTSKNQHFELSFGQSLLFISNSKQINIRNEQAVVIPTSSLLFFGEIRPQKFLRIPLFLNVPTESKQFLVNGV